MTCLQKNASEVQMQQEEQKVSHLKNKYSMTSAEISMENKIFFKKRNKGRKYSVYNLLTDLFHKRNEGKI